MYNAPPGLKEKEQREKEKQEATEKEKLFQGSLVGLSRDEKRKRELEYEETLTDRERQMRRFGHILQNAPVKNASVNQTTASLNLKPFGQIIKNVRCFKCGQWGHRVGDAECDYSRNNPFNVTRISEQDPMAEYEAGKTKKTKEEKEEALKKREQERDSNLVIKNFDRPHGGFSNDHFTQQYVSDLESSGDDMDVDELGKTLTVEQMKELLNKIEAKRKKSKKKKKKKKKKRKKRKRKRSSSSSDSEEERKKKKRKKSKKRKKRLDSDSESD